MADKVHCVKKTLRLTPDESRLLSEKAKASNMNEAEYLRLLISQKPNDYPEIRQELKQLISEFVALLKQANTDSAKMAEVIGVSDAQLRFVTNSQSGMGLLKCGNVVIPFDNQIGKDTSLYKLYNTNLHEKIAEQKEKEKKQTLD